MVCNTTIEEIFDEFGGTYETHILGRYKRIRNFLFSSVSTSLHLVYNCYIIQYVKD